MNFRKIKTWMWKVFFIFYLGRNVWLSDQLLGDIVMISFVWFSRIIQSLLRCHCLNLQRRLKFAVQISQVTRQHFAPLDAISFSCFGTKLSPDYRTDPTWKPADDGRLSSDISELENVFQGPYVEGLRKQLVSKVSAVYVVWLGSKGQFVGLHKQHLLGKRYSVHPMHGYVNRAKCFVTPKTIVSARHAGDFCRRFLFFSWCLL